MIDVRYAIDRMNSNRSDSKNNIYINCVGSVSSENGIHNNQYRYDYYLIYVQEGSIDIQTKKLKTTLRKGHFIILPPHNRTVYSSPKNKNIHYLWLHFTGTKAEELVKNSGLETNRVYSIGTHTIFPAYWKSLYREFVTNDNFFISACANILSSIFIDLSRLVNNKHRAYNLKSIHYIHENLYSNLEMKTLAKIEGLSESRYRALFTKTTGISPINYIINQRMDAATDLLVNTTASISEIAKTVGYYDTYYFSRLFKKRIGISPSKYRRQTI